MLNAEQFRKLSIQRVLEVIEHFQESLRDKYPKLSNEHSNFIAGQLAHYKYRWNISPNLLFGLKNERMSFDKAFMVTPKDDSQTIFENFRCLILDFELDKIYDT